MKNLVTSFILFFFIPVCGQNSVNDTLKKYYQDSLIVNKNFKDGTISNKLTVKVINPCNSEKRRFDGAVTMITATVKNKKEILDDYGNKRRGTDMDKRYEKMEKNANLSS